MGDFGFLALIVAIVVLGVVAARQEMKWDRKREEADQRMHDALIDYGREMERIRREHEKSEAPHA